MIKVIINMSILERLIKIQVFCDGTNQVSHYIKNYGNEHAKVKIIILIEPNHNVTCFILGNLLL